MLAIIPIRKGSVRIKNKNLQKINKKTLVEITLDKAINSNVFTKIVVFHDYSQLNFKKKYKTIDFIKRPKKISGRKNTTEETLEYFFRQYPEYKIFIDFCILQVTSPLRKISTIKNGIKKFHKTKQNSLVSVKFKSITDKNSNKIFYITDKKKLIPNGVLYISNIENFLKTGKIYNKNSELIVLGSKESIDIDTLEDLKTARNLI
mgnify:CR=1